MQQVLDFFKQLLSGEGFIPRWVCGSWTPFHGWLYILSDFVIWLSYFAIPVLLLYFIIRKAVTPFKPVFWWFIAFILLCGLTHILDVIIFYEPIYRLSAFVRFLTAIVSLSTVFVLAKKLPTALAARSQDDLYRAVEDKTRELKSLNEILLFEKSRIESIVKASPYGLLVVNEEGKIVQTNAEIQKILGYTSEEILGKPIEFLIPEEFRPMHKKDRNNYIKNPAPRSMGRGRDLFARSKDGRNVPVEVGLSPIDHGNRKMVVASIVDNSYRKSLELVKDKQVDRLNRLTDELKRRNEQHENFNYIVSHNLRSQIGNLRSLQKMISDERTTPEQKEELTIKSRQVLEKFEDTFTTLTNMLKAVNTGDQNIEMISFSGILSHVELSFQAEIEKQQASIIHDFSVSEMAYSRVFIESFVHNLLSNAIKYRKPDVAPEIHFSTREFEDFVILTCMDNGLGMDLDKVGGNLFSFGKTFHGGDDANGIGLYITNKQVQKLGGKIEVESEPGEGTTFHFYLKKQSLQTASV